MDLWNKGTDLAKDADARGIILYGAAISISERLGLGKEENYAYDIYELEFIPEVLFGVIVYIRQYAKNQRYQR